MFGVELKVLDTRGRQVGGIKYMMVGYEFSDRTLSRWAYQVALLEYQRWGQGGNALNNFYTYNRIIEKDRFLVWIK